MKLAVSTLTCPDWQLERVIAAAKANGLDGIEFRGLEKEIDVTRLIAFSVEADKTLAQLRNAGLSIPCLATSVTLLAPVGPRWDGMIEECHRYAKLASAAGAPWIRILGGLSTGELSAGERLQLARRRLRQIVKICRANGCRPVVETHGQWATGALVRELLDGFEPDDAGALWDWEHPFRRGESPAETARCLGPYLAHVHVKDSILRGGRSIPELLGQGELPLAECFRALRDAEYAGWLTLEVEKRWIAEAPEPDKSIPHFAAFVRERAESVAK